MAAPPCFSVPPVPCAQAAPPPAANMSASVETKTLFVMTFTLSFIL
jgi:hypothetical protein